MKGRVFIISPGWNSGRGKELWVADALWDAERKWPFLPHVVFRFYQWIEKQSHGMRMRRQRRRGGEGKVDTMNTEHTEYWSNRVPWTILNHFCMHLLSECTFVSTHLIAWLYLDGVEFKKNLPEDNSILEVNLPKYKLQTKKSWILWCLFEQRQEELFF